MTDLIRSAIPAPRVSRLPRAAPSRRPHDPATGEFHRALCDLVRAHQSRSRDLAGAHGLSTSAAHALRTLARLEEITVGRLAEELMVEKSTASRIAGGLKQKGYLEYVSSPEDRRVQGLKLTGEGREVYDRIERETLRELAGVLGPSGPRASRRMAGLLREIAHRMAASGRD